MADDLSWELRASGSFETIRDFVSTAGRKTPEVPGLDPPYDAFDVAPFSPAGAVYFMNGSSEATVRLRGSGEEFTLQFEDDNTSIAASPPTTYEPGLDQADLYVPVPPPLRPTATYPRNTPDRYRRPTALHFLQVVSMNMRSQDGKSRLLIGLPYAEAYPELFFSTRMEAGDKDASSYGVVQSLTERVDRAGGTASPRLNGHPARSFFGIYHLIETPFGTFFNKKATQMELQPDQDGKLALALPPIPFTYSLMNGPIPLFSIDDPDGVPLADVVAAHHHAARPAVEATADAWPFREVAARVERPGRRGSK